MLKIRINRIIFEKNIYDCLELTRNIVYMENYITETFGKNSSSINYMLSTPNFNICFHNKWISVKPSLTSINHFIQSVNNISRISNKKCYGIFISNMPLTSTCLLALKNENERNENLKLIFIQNSNQDIIIKELLLYLYSINIYLYEEDNSCIMLDYY